MVATETAQCVAGECGWVVCMTSLGQHGDDKVGPAAVATVARVATRRHAFVMRRSNAMPDAAERLYFAEIAYRVVAISVLER